VRYTSCVYQTQDVSVVSIDVYLESYFQGYAGTGPTFDYASNDVAAGLFQHGNVSTTTLDSKFRNISAAMTNYMRQNGGLLGPNSRTKDGFLETFYHQKLACM
jgi:hypothetical protein